MSIFKRKIQEVLDWVDVDKELVNSEHSDNVWLFGIKIKSYQITRVNKIPEEPSKTKKGGSINGFTK